MAQRYTEPTTSNQLAPGPGTYALKNQFKYPSTPGTKIGTSTRDVEENLRKKFANYPPPNTYNPKENANSASFSFGTSKRQNMSMTNLKTPAPNTYNLMNRSVDKGPSYQIGLRLETSSSIGNEVRKTKGNPGPGTYAPNVKTILHNDGMYSIKSRALEK